MTNFYKILGLAIFGLFLFINIYTINDGHNWGDDFAQYIHHAVNLVEHKSYTSDISLDYWIVYPPGFPLLLSSLIFWFGLNFKILKLLNVLVWALSALVVYDLALKRLNLLWARILTVWFLSLPYFFFFKQNVLSDLPFMSFVLLSIWSLMKLEEAEEKGLKDSSRFFLFLSIVFISYALLIRWAGGSLFLAVAVYFLVIRGEFNKLWGFVLGAIISLSVALKCGSLVSGYFYKTTVSLYDWFLAIWYNISYNFEMFLSFFIPDDKLFSKLIMLLNAYFINVIFAVFLFAIIGVFLYRLCQKRVSFMGCFVFFYLMGVMLWPVRGGSRYVLPIMIPVTIIMIQFCRPVLQKFVMVVFLVLICQNIYIIGSNLKFKDDDIFQKDSLEMLQWVVINIKPDERYMFAKPRAVSLLTHRVGASFWVHAEDKDVWYKRIKPLHINYLIADKQYDQFSQYNDLNWRVNKDELICNRIWENSRYKIFKVSDLLGKD